MILLKLVSVNGSRLAQYRNVKEFNLIIDKLERWNDRRSKNGEIIWNSLESIFNQGKRYDDQ